MFGCVLGSLVSFVWGFASHVILGLGQVAFAELPNSGAVIAASTDSPQARTCSPGLSDPESPEAVAFTESYLAGPMGMVIYQPEGDELMGPKKMGIEFATGSAICPTASEPRPSGDAGAVAATYAPDPLPGAEEGG